MSVVCFFLSKNKAQRELDHVKADHRRRDHVVDKELSYLEDHSLLK